MSRHFQTIQQSLPIECKESARWVEQFELFDRIVGELKHTQGVSVSDCESDIYELFIAKRSGNVDLIARSQHNRDILLPEGKIEKLQTYISKQPVAGHCWLDVLKEDKHTYRPVELAIRFGEVSVKIPENVKWSSTIPRTARRLAQRMADKNGLTLRVIQVTEINPVQGRNPLNGRY